MGLREIEPASTDGPEPTVADERSSGPEPTTELRVEPTASSEPEPTAIPLAASSWTPEIEDAYRTRLDAVWADPERAMGACLLYHGRTFADIYNDNYSNDPSANLLAVLNDANAILDDDVRIGAARVSAQLAVDNCSAATPPVSDADLAWVVRFDDGEFAEALSASLASLDRPDLADTVEEWARIGDVIPEVRRMSDTMCRLVVPRISSAQELGAEMAPSIRGFDFGLSLSDVDVGTIYGFAVAGTCPDAIGDWPDNDEFESFIRTTFESVLVDAPLAPTREPITNDLAWAAQFDDEQFALGLASFLEVADYQNLGAQIIVWSGFSDDLIFAMRETAATVCQTIVPNVSGLDELGQTLAPMIVGADFGSDLSEGDVAVIYGAATAATCPQAVGRWSDGEDLELVVRTVFELLLENSGTQPAVTGELTTAQRNAVREAESYLNFRGWSRQGLIDQLSSEFGAGYEVADATIAVDSLDIDYFTQAERVARSYIELRGFSCSRLVDQLSSEFGSQFTLEQSRHGASAVDVC